MSKFLALAKAVYGIFRRYPAATTGALSVAVALLARFGLHVTADQLVAIVAPLAALVAAVVHATVTPTAKQPPQ